MRAAKHRMSAPALQKCAWSHVRGQPLLSLGAKHPQFGVCRLRCRFESDAKGILLAQCKKALQTPLLAFLGFVVHTSWAGVSFTGVPVKTWRV